MTVAPAFATTLGLPNRQPLPTTVRVPLTDPTNLPPLGLLRDAYIVHLTAQMAETAANRLKASRPLFAHTGLVKRLGSLHHAADTLLGNLFGSFDNEATDVLNNLTSLAEVTLTSLVTLAVAPSVSLATLTRVSELLHELNGLAVGVTPAPNLVEEAVTE